MIRAILFFWILAELNAPWPIWLAFVIGVAFLLVTWADKTLGPEQD